MFVHGLHRLHVMRIRYDWRDSRKPRVPPLNVLILLIQHRGNKWRWLLLCWLLGLLLLRVVLGLSVLRVGDIGGVWLLGWVEAIMRLLRELALVLRNSSAGSGFVILLLLLLLSVSATAAAEAEYGKCYDDGDSTDNTSGYDACVITTTVAGW